MKTMLKFYTILALWLTASFMMPLLAQVDLSSGKKLVETGQWNKANQFFIDQVAKNPSDAESKFYLAETFLGLNKVDSAASNYTKGAAINSDFAFNNAGLGRIALTKGDTVKAKEYFTLAIKEDKKNVDLYAYIAKAAVITNQPKLAAQYIAKGKEINVKNANLHMAEGDLWRLKGNAGEAANAYERSIFYNKSNALASVKLGVIFTEARNWDVASTNFSKALEVDPNYSLAFKGLGDMYYKKGDFKAASENYKKYLSLSEENLEDTYRYAFILFYNKENEEASKLLNTLLARDPNNPVLLRLQAYMSYERGVDEKGKVSNPENISQAKANIEKFLQVQAKEKYLSSDFEYLAKILAASGLDSLAPRNFLKAYQLDTTRTTLLEDAAKAYVKAEKYDSSAHTYKKLLTVSDANQAINYFQMGRMYYLSATKKDTAKADSLVRIANLVSADSAFKKVAELNPNSILGPLWMARAETMLDAVSQEGLANASYEKVIQLIVNANEQAKRKNELFEAYNYFASLFYFKAYVAKTSKKDNAAFQEAKTKSLEYWSKMEEVSPGDPKIAEGIKAVNDLNKIK